MFKPTVILPLFALWLTFNLLSGCRAQVPTAYQTDPTAEKMLLYQRDNGGWAQYHGDRTDYSLPMTDSLEAVLVNDKDRLDTTIDDGSTTNEINYLLKAYGQTANPAYLASAEKGARIWEIMIGHLVALVEELKGMTLEEVYQKRY